MAGYPRQMLMLNRRLIIVALLAGIVAPALAQQPAPEPGVAFEQRLRDAAERADSEPQAAREDLRRLMDELRLAIAAAPEDAALPYLLGRAHLHLDEPEPAADLLARAVELDPGHAGAWFYLGLVRLYEEDEDGALQAWRRAIEADPQLLEAHYNIGQTSQNRGRLEESLEAFQRVLVLRPDDWRARAKVIQNLQSLGRVDEVERERAELFKQHAEGEVDADFYCREQFREGDQRVMAFEYFKLEGERALRYVFQVLPPEQDTPLYRISLGSYELTTRVSRELKEIGPDERVFHLDGYYPGGEHRTFGFFNTEPTYEQTRAQVVAIMQGKLKEISSSRRVSATGPAK